jgi:hypothetical protein
MVELKTRVPWISDVAQSRPLLDGQWSSLGRLMTTIRFVLSFPWNGIKSMAQASNNLRTNACIDLFNFLSSVFIEPSKSATYLFWFLWGWCKTKIVLEFFIYVYAFVIMPSSMFMGSLFSYTSISQELQEASIRLLAFTWAYLSGNVDMNDPQQVFTLDRQLRQIDTFGAITSFKDIPTWHGAAQ